MSEWFYVKSGKQVGPVSDQELEGLLTNGELPHDVKVWKEGLTDWVTATERNSVITEAGAGAEKDVSSVVAAQAPLAGLGTFLPMSVVACCIFLLNPFAAFALVYALQAKNAHNDGRVEDAQRKLASCKKMLIIATIFAVILYSAAYWAVMNYPTALGLG